MINSKKTILYAKFEPLMTSLKNKPIRPKISFTNNVTYDVINSIPNV